MKQHLSAMLACSSLIALASTITAHAADSAAPSLQQTAEVATPDEGLEEIIITARRKAENLQDVPETVSVVTAKSLEDFNIFSFQDIQKLVPGLTLSADTTGYLNNVSMRGVTYMETQNLPPTTTIYLNDTPVDANVAFQSMYDVGQIEVLRGPTGTTRGIISPSGSITITTKKPDLEQVGGFLTVTVGALSDTNLQGAVNVPIVEDKFAIRIAGERTEDEGNGVTSVVSKVTPNEQTDAARVSARFAPTDDIDANVSFEHLRRHQELFTSAVFGNGAPGGIVPGTTFSAPPAGYNGPFISRTALESTESNPGIFGETLNDLQGSIDATFYGQKLEYIGSWYSLGLHAQASSTDNTIPGFDTGTLTTSTEEQWSQEVRLSSVEPLFAGHLDYTAGFFYNKTIVGSSDNGGQTYFSGAFGSPAGNPILRPPNLAYALVSDASLPSNDSQYAGYGSLTYHLDKKTEITGGVRYGQQNLVSEVSSSNPYAALLPIFNLHGAPCPTSLVADPNYAGYCDFPVGSTVPNVVAQTKHYRPFIYNVEASHHFNDDLMVYFRTATSFRPGNLQPIQALTGATTPAIQPFIFPNPEKSTDYEGGIKAAFFDKRLEIDVDYFHQIYKGFFFQTPEFYYLKTSTLSALVAPTVSQTSVVYNVPAVVDGIEFNASGKLTKNWTASGAFAWAKGNLSNATIPCNPKGTVTGVAPLVSAFPQPGPFFNTCSGGNASTSANPLWNFNIQSEYDLPINDAVGAFVRGLLYYYPSNPYGSGAVAGGYVVPAYATVDLYLGLHDPTGKWQAELYGKNTFNDRTVVFQSPTVFQGPAAQFFGPTGYTQLSLVARREFGLTLRYAFGSR
jgi:iron complex outermembrane receptor protein